MFSLKNESKNIKTLFFAVLTIFFILCIWSIFYYGDSTFLGSFEKYNNDDVKYIRSAKVLLNEGMFTYKKPDVSTVFIMPGLPFTIAFFIAIFGNVAGIVAFRIFQAILQTLCLALAFFIGRKIFNSKVGIVSMILTLFYLVDIWASNMFLTETIFKFLFLTMFYFILFALEEKKTKYYIVAGICFALSLLYRPPVALLPLVIIIMWIKYKYTFKECLKYTGIVALITVLVMSPWWIRNYNRFNMFIPFTLSSGNPMWLGSYIDNNRGGDPLKGTKYDTFRIENIEKETKPGMNKEIIANLKEVDRAKNRISAHFEQRPLKTLRWYLIGKPAHLFKYPFYWFKVARPYVYVYHAVLIALSAIGFIIYLRNRSLNATFMMLTILYFVITAIPFVNFSRYYYHLMTFNIILASLTICKTIDFIKLKRLRNR